MADRVAPYGITSLVTGDVANGTPVAIGDPGLIAALEARAVQTAATPVGDPDLIAALESKAKKPEVSVALDVAKQAITSPFQGFNNLYYLPNSAVNFLSSKLGGPEALLGVGPENPAGEPETAAGRYTQSIGEQLGASAIPAAGLAMRGANALVRPLGYLADYLLGSAGAGTAVQAVRDYGGGPIAQTVAGMVGGIGGAAAGTMAARTGRVAGAAYKYGRDMARGAESIPGDAASGPYQAGLTKVADTLAEAGVGPGQLERQVAPPVSWQLSTRQNNPIVQADINEMIAQSLEGRTAAAIAADYGVHPSTVTRYVNTYREANITPMSILDLAKETRGEGAALPVTRLGKASASLSQDSQAAEALHNRQLGQQGRAADIIQQTTSDAELTRRAAQAEADFRAARPAPNAPLTATEKTALQAEQSRVRSEFEAQRDQGREMEFAREDLNRRTQAQTNANYAKLHALPDIVVDENLGRILAQPLARQQWDKARMLAEADGTQIPTYDEITRTFGIRPKGGLGLDRETGTPEAPAQYPGNPPAQPAALVPVRALDYFQRALRLDAKSGGTEGHALNTIRQRVIDALDPQNPVAGHTPLVPGFRATMGAYRTGMAGDEAFAAGEALVAKASSPTRAALREFDNMTPDQQHLFRMGFARKLMDGVSGTNESANAVAKFQNEGTRQTIRRVFPQEQADAMIRGMRRENITTGTRNDIYRGSQTAEKSSDMAKLMDTAKAAADFVTGGPLSWIRNLSNRLAYQIGERQSQEIVRILAQTDPPRLLRTLNDLAGRARTAAERQAYLVAAREARTSLRMPLTAGVVTNALAGSDRRNALSR